MVMKFCLHLLNAAPNPDIVRGHKNFTDFKFYDKGMTNPLLTQRQNSQWYFDGLIDVGRTPNDILALQTGLGELPKAF